VRWLRYAYAVASPPLLAGGERTVKDVADRLGVSESAVYYWISPAPPSLHGVPWGRFPRFRGTTRRSDS
jgi:transposase-like protein